MALNKNPKYKNKWEAGERSWYTFDDVLDARDKAPSIKSPTTTPTATTPSATSPAVTAPSKNVSQGIDYGSVDYGTIGKEQMAAGADWQDVLETYNSRFNKAMGTEGLQKYANDEVQKEMWDYITSHMQTADPTQAGAQDWLAGYAQNNAQPTYESKYDPQIDAILNEILNREDFAYNAENDPLYQQYRRMFLREGDRAMSDTLAEAASGAGGMNTYAITAAQQANNNFRAQLNDKIPELYQLAYEMYLSDIDRKVQDLGILQNADATQYAKYRDTMNDWKNDRDFAYGAYQDDVAQGNWQKNFGRGVYESNRDFNFDKEWTQKEWLSNQADKNLSNTRYDQETAKDEVWRLIELGVTPSADLIKKAGMSQADVDIAVNAAKTQIDRVNTREDFSVGLSDGGTEYKFEGAPAGDKPVVEYDGSGDQINTDDENIDDYHLINTHGESWVSVAGFGRLTWEEASELLESGEIVEVINKDAKTVSYAKAK